jgi:hypothetical protein
LAERSGRGAGAGDGDDQRRYTDQSKERIAAALADVVEASAALRVRADPVSARIGPLNRRVERCMVRVREAMRGDALRFVGPPSIDKKMTIAAARERIAQLGADLKEIEAAPYTREEVKRMITQWVDAELRKPAVGPLFDRGREGGGVYVPGALLKDGFRPNVLGLVLWLGRDEIIRRLHADADRLADDAHALSDDQRDKRLAKCRDDILQAERVEEFLAWQHLEKGEPIVLRGDADLRAILSIE